MKRLIFRSAMLLGMLLCVELLGQVVNHSRTGAWLWNIPKTPHQQLFQRHPWLLVSGIPNATFQKSETVSVKHNSRGYRGPDFTEPRPAHTVRIICYGGSTTYGNYLSDAWTWPALLQKSLGSSYEVLNAGVPGYTTVEHVIQAALQQQDKRADFALYYVGYNDVFNNNVTGLAEDLSDVHAPLMEEAMLLNSPGWWCDRSFILSAAWGRLFLFVTKHRPVIIKGEYNDRIDPRALDLFKHRIRTLILLCRQNGIQPIFIPQMINPTLRGNPSNTRSTWNLFVPQHALPNFLDRYNREVERICAEEHVRVIKPAPAAQWTSADFFDECHFTPSGSAKFASSLQKEVARVCRT